MREILFRGRRKKGDKRWVEGDLTQGYAGYVGIVKWCCAGTSFEVVPETVGQYTGLTDKNGKKIFEGDICWFYGGDYYSGLWEQNAIVALTDMTDNEQTHYLNDAEYCEVIGNVYDNPELLEVEKCGCEVCKKLVRIFDGRN